MSFIAAAIIGAGGALGGALLTSSAASKASQAQVGMQQQALAQQQKMFGVAQDSLNPFIKAGQGAVPTLSDLLTPGKSADTLSQMPGFQFASQYGTKAATNALTARGLGASAGPVGTAVGQFNTGLAGKQWQDTVNALMGFTGQGVTAGSALAGNALGTGTNIGATLGNIGNAQASGILGSANALAGGLTGGANSAVNMLLLNKLMGGGGGGGIYANAADAGVGSGVGSGGYNFLDAQAGY